MGFSERTKLSVKRKADFTCCWCKDRKKKVEVHHITPQSEGGSDEEDNAAPLCPDDHDAHGGNPNHRTEIRRRRDQWYEECSKTLNPEYGWPIGLDVPMLSFEREIPPPIGIPTKGIQFTDRDPTNANNPPLLYLSVYFKSSMYFGQPPPQENEKWLYLEANMRFALNLRIQVRAWNDLDVLELMGFLTNYEDKYLPKLVLDEGEDFLEQYVKVRESGWDLRGRAPVNSEHGSGDFFRVWRERDENRMMISTFTPTYAGISIHARFSSEVASALSGYLEDVGFAEPFPPE